MNFRLGWQIALWLWIAVMWILSTIRLSLPEVPSGDKISHFVAYGLLTWLATNLNGRKFPVWLAASVMGIAVECVQYFLPWRSFELLDILANSTGALLGVLLASTPFGRLLPRLEQWKKHD